VSCVGFLLVPLNRQLAVRTVMESMLSIDPLVAYFDPGSGSLLMQALVGGTAGLIVFARYLWEAAPSLFRGCASRDKSR
jgi:hypothetical protein